MTITGIIIILVSAVILTAFIEGADRLAEKKSQSDSIRNLIFITGIVIASILGVCFMHATPKTTISKTYQLKLNNEGHTQYSVKTDDIYKVTTNHNKEMTVDNPDDIVYNKTEKSTLKIKTTTSYLPIFGHNIKINIDKTQKLYIIK